MAIPLIVELEKLRVLLDKSGVERTNGLAEMMGDDCPHYKRSLNLFLDKDYKQLLDQLTVVLNEYKKIEGKHGTT